MSSNLVETVIGALVIAIAAAFLLYAYNTSSEGQATGGYDVSVEFDRVDGLTAGSDVRMSGIKIGNVKSMRLDQESYFAKVTLSISPDVMLPADSNAKITSAGLLGDYYVSIVAGGSTETIEPGGEIKYSQGAIDLMNLISEAVFSTSSGGS